MGGLIYAVVKWYGRFDLVCTVIGIVLGIGILFKELVVPRCWLKRYHRN